MKKTLTLFALILLVFKFYFWLTVYPLFDEAYYWLWGLNPSLSYHDHPGLQPWIQGVFYTLFGNSQFILRLPAFICIIVLAFIYLRILKNLNSQKNAFIVILSILFTPLIFLLTSMAWNDYLLITMTLCSAYFWLNYFSAIWKGEKGNASDLFLGFLFVGLSGLSKYNAVFIALAIASMVISNKKLHRVFKDYRVYLGVLFCIIIISPIFIWNYYNDNGSFQFTLGQRTISPMLSLKFKGNMGGYIIGSILMISPITWYGIVLCLKKQPISVISTKNTYSIIYMKFAKHIFLWSSLTTLFISLFSLALYWWNIVAYVLILPVALIKLYEKNWLKGNLIYSTIVISFMIFHLGVMPFNVFFDAKDDENAHLYGWPEIGERVNHEMSKNNGDIQIFTSNYRTSSLLSFELDRDDIYSYSPRFDQFDYWTKEKRYTNEQALILTDDWHKMNYELENIVKNITLLDTIHINKWGYHIKDYYLYSAKIKDEHTITKN